MPAFSGVVPSVGEGHVRGNGWAALSQRRIGDLRAKARRELRRYWLTKTRSRKAKNGVPEYMLEPSLETDVVAHLDLVSPVGDLVCRKLILEKTVENRHEISPAEENELFGVEGKGCKTLKNGLDRKLICHQSPDEISSLSCAFRFTHRAPQALYARAHRRAEQREARPSAARC